MEQLYVQIYSQLTTYAGEASRVLIVNTLKWLLCAQTTLNASTFLRAVSVKNGEPSPYATKEILLDLCHNLVVYDEGLDIFRFAHLSVREFLENRAEFSEASCNTVAAESCLLHMIATTDSSNRVSALADGHIVDLPKRLTLTESATLAEFVAYGLDFSMTHCNLASRNARTADTNFGRIFRSFISSRPPSNMAFNAWVQKFCRNVHMAPEWFSQLQSLLSRYHTCPLASFYVAVTYGYSEIVDACLQKNQISTEERRSALILAMVSVQNEVVDTPMESETDIEITPTVLRYAAQYLEKERLVKLLGSDAGVYLDQRIITAGINHTYDGRIGLLLEQNPEFTITSETLGHAAERASVDDFRLLLNRTAHDRMPSYILSIAMYQPNLEKIALLLNKADRSSITSALGTLDSNISQCDDITKLNIMKVLLAHGGGSCITAYSVWIAVLNRNREKLDLLLLHGGKITQDMLEDNAMMVGAEVLDVLLEHGCEINCKTLKKAAEWSYWKRDGHASLPLLFDRADDTVTVQEISNLLHGFARCGHECIETMTRLLDRAGENLIAQEMSGLLRNAADSDELGSTEMLRLLLDRAEDRHVTEDVLMIAAQNKECGSEFMPLLLERAQTAVFTECVVREAVKRLPLDAAMQLLACFGEIDVTIDVLEAAAHNRSCGGELVRRLLEKAGMTTFPEDAFVEATKNKGNGREAIQALEEAFGPIEMTEGKLSTLIRAGALTEHLLRWLEPELLTEEVLMAAVSMYRNDIVRAVIKKPGHLPITLEVLKAAANVYPLQLFRFFWAHGRTASIPESLLEAAARNMDEEIGYSIVEFLLEEAEEIHAGEPLSVAVAEQTIFSVKTFDLLLQKNVPVVITQHALKAAVEAHDRGRSPGPIEWLYNYNPNLEITDELFQTAASNGKEDVLLKLSHYRGLKDPPSKWLNVAKVFNAANDGDTSALKDLLDRGITPDTPNTQGRTPLFAAVQKYHKTAVTMLLSFGALPDPVVKRITPLCYCAAEEYGDNLVTADLAKILVEAGASVGFKDGRGRTPEEIARKSRKVLILRYLERCRIERENAGRARPPSS